MSPLKETRNLFVSGTKLQTRKSFAASAVAVADDDSDDDDDVVDVDMRPFILCFLFFNFLLGVPEIFGNLTDVGATASDILSRPKRYVTFPEGSNVQLVYCLTIGAYGREGDLVMGLTAALAWELPTKLDTKLSSVLHRRTRSALFPKMEAFLQSVGLDGRSCVMRALCEAAQRNPSDTGNGTFLQELLHAIFTLPKDGQKFERIEDRVYDYAYQTTGNCAELYPTCPYTIYNLLF